MNVSVKILSSQHCHMFVTALSQVCHIAVMCLSLQALWHCLRNPPDNVAHVAFRVLGKFGGSNRKMLKEAQKVRLGAVDSVSHKPCHNLKYVSQTLSQCIVCLINLVTV